MDLTKLFKVIEFTWPFIKEIVLDKDAPKADRRKKGIVFTLLTTLVLFGAGAWGTVQTYVQPFLPPSQTSAPSQYDRTRWVRFLEDQMTEKAAEVIELQVQLEATSMQLKTERNRVEDLAQRLEVLESKLTEDTQSPIVPLVDPPPTSGMDLFDQLNALRTNS
jgi:TolA-binding protein